MKRALLFLLGVASLVSCRDEATPTSPLTPPPPDTLVAPADMNYIVSGGVLTVGWSPVPNAEGYRVELYGPPQDPERSVEVAADDTSASFDVVVAGADYVVAVMALSGSHERGPARRRDIRVPTRDETVDSITASFSRTLHGTARGMGYWYSHSTGYAQQIGVPYSQLRTCQGCHVYNPALTGAPADQPCLACHPPREDDPTLPNYDIVDDTKCMACHGRQAAEIAMNLPDVHRTAGMTCSECHNAAEIHGGVAANTMFDVITTSCKDCHNPGGGVSSGPAVPQTTSHTQHQSRLSCQACHMSGSVTCYNCHLSEEIETGARVAYRRYGDWLFLGNWRGQVYPLNFQSVQYQGETFNAWGPFHGHTITDPGRDCGSCHFNLNARLLQQQGYLQVTSWDVVNQTLQHLTGVIPLPPDYMTRLKYDYMTKQPDGTWAFVETGPDRSQMLYATPLTDHQMRMLRARHGIH